MVSDAETNDAINYNNASILERIKDCIAYGGGGSTSSLSVGFYDDAAISKLKTAIREALSKNVETSEKNSEKSNEKLDLLAKILNDSEAYNEDLLYRLKLISQNVDDLNKKNLNNWFGLRNYYTNVIRSFPIISFGLETLIGLGKSYLNLQMQSLNYMREFVNAGVFYADSYSDISKFASDIGISSDTLVKALVQNSSTVARLEGLTGNGAVSLTKLFKAVKETGDSLGMNFSTSVKIADEMVKNSGITILETGNSFERLISQTEIYQKHLQKLSYATGKTVENIMAENKIREDKMTMELWASDPTNKMFYDVLKQLGIDDSVIQTFAQGGIPTEDFLKMYATSDVSREFLGKIMDIYNNLGSYNGESDKLLEDMLSAFPRELALQQREFYKGQPLLVNAFNQMGAGTRSGFNLMNAGLTIKREDFEKILNNVAPLEKQANIMKEITKIWEGFLNRLKMDAPTINNILSTINIFFYRLENSIKHLLNGDFGKAYSALTETSKGEQKFLQKDYKVQISSNDQKLEEIKKQKEELEQKEELATDERKRLEALEKEERELLKKNEELNELYKKSIKTEESLVQERRNQIYDEKSFFDKVWYEFGNEINWFRDKEMLSFIPSSYQDILKKIEEREINVTNEINLSVSDLLDNGEYENKIKSLDRFDQILLDKSDLQMQSFFVGNREELDYFKKQISNMTTEKNRQLTDEEVVDLINKFNKNNPSYRYEGDMKTVMTEVLLELRNQSGNLNEIRVQNEQKENLTSY